MADYPSSKATTSRSTALIDRIGFGDADSTLHFFFPEDIANAFADSANRISITRVFSSQSGKY